MSAASSPPPHPAHPPTTTTMDSPPTDCLFDWAESEQVTVHDAAGQLVVKVPLQMVRALPEDMQDWTFYLKLIGAAMVYEDGCNLVNEDGQLVDFTEAVMPGTYKIVFVDQPYRACKLRDGPWLQAEGLGSKWSPPVSLMSASEPDSDRQCQIMMRDGGCILTGSTLTEELRCVHLVSNTHPSLRAVLRKILRDPWASFAIPRNGLVLAEPWATRFERLELGLMPVGLHPVLPFARLVVILFTGHDEADAEVHGKVLDAEDLWGTNPSRRIPDIPPKELLLWHMQQCVKRCLRDGCQPSEASTWAPDLSRVQQIPPEAAEKYRDAVVLEHEDKQGDWVYGDNYAELLSLDTQGAALRPFAKRQRPLPLSRASMPAIHFQRPTLTSMHSHPPPMSTLAPMRKSA